MRLPTILAVLPLILSLAPVARCTQPSKVDEAPALSSDGLMVAFVRDENRVMLIDSSGRRLRTLTWRRDKHPGEALPEIVAKPMWENGSYPSISPDASSVAWAHGQGGDFPRLGPYSEFQNLYVTDLRSRRVRRVTSGGGGLPVWSPDGRWIAYVTPRGELKAVNPQSRKTRLLARKTIAIDNLSWLSSGPAAAVERNGAVAWYSIRQSGELHRVTSPLKLPHDSSPATERRWALSQDGSRAVCLLATVKASDYADCRVFAVGRSGWRRITRLDGRQFHTPIAGPNTGLLYAAISGNGRTFAVAVQGSIWTGDMRTGRIRQVTKTLH